MQTEVLTIEMIQHELYPIDRQLVVIILDQLIVLNEDVLGMKLI